MGDLWGMGMIIQLKAEEAFASLEFPSQQTRFFSCQYQKKFCRMKYETGCKYKINGL